MVYISSDGRVGGQKSLWSKIMDFFSSIFTLISLFFTTVTNPNKVTEHRPRRTYAERNGGSTYRSSNTSTTKGSGNRLGGRGANIKGLNGLGDANCKMGG